MYNFQDTIVHQSLNYGMMLQTAELQRAVLAQTVMSAAQQAQVARLIQATNVPYPAYTVFEYPYPYFANVNSGIIQCCCSSATVRPTPKAEPPEPKPPTYPPSNNPISPLLNHNKIYFNERYFPEHKPKRSFFAFFKSLFSFIRR